MTDVDAVAAAAAAQSELQAALTEALAGLGELERQVASLEGDVARYKRQADRLRGELGAARHERDRLRREADPDYDPSRGDPTKQMGVGAIPIGSAVDLRPVERLERAIGLGPSLDEHLATAMGDDDRQDHDEVKRLASLHHPGGSNEHVKALTEGSGKVSKAAMVAVDPQARQQSVDGRVNLALLWWSRSIMRALAALALSSDVEPHLAEQIASYLRAHRQRLDLGQFDSAAVHQARQWAQAAQRLGPSEVRAELERWA